MIRRLGIGENLEQLSLNGQGPLNHGRLTGEGPGQGGLARPWRPPQEDRGKQAVGFDGPAQQLAGAEQVEGVRDGLQIVDEHDPVDGARCVVVGQVLGQVAHAQLPLGRVLAEEAPHVAGGDRGEVLAALVGVNRSTLAHSAQQPHRQRTGAGNDGHRETARLNGGRMSAGRILVELNGFDAVLMEQGGASVNPAASEAAMALESLGFKKEQISKVLSRCSATDTAGLVKEALKQLQKL